MPNANWMIQLERRKPVADVPDVLADARGGLRIDEPVVQPITEAAVLLEPAWDTAP